MKLLRLFLFSFTIASKDLPVLSNALIKYFEQMAFICSATYCYEKIMDMTCGHPCRFIQNTFTPIKTFHSNLTTSAAMIGILKYRNYPSTLIVAYRGSFTSKNWFLNFNYQLIPWKRKAIKDNGEQVHRGYALAYTSLHEVFTFLREYLSQILSPPLPNNNSSESGNSAVSGSSGNNSDNVKNHGIIEKIVVTGQSYGGAVATLAALDIVTILEREIGNLPPVELVTFSSPRVGNKAFVDCFKKYLKTGNTFRITVGNDPIVHFPTISQGYWHVPQEVFVGEDYVTYYCDKENGEDENCSGGQKYPINFLDHAWFEGARFGAPCLL